MANDQKNRAEDTNKKTGTPSQPSQETAHGDADAPMVPGVVPVGRPAEPGTLEKNPTQPIAPAQSQTQTDKKDSR